MSALGAAGNLSSSIKRDYMSRKHKTLQPLQHLPLLNPVLLCVCCTYTILAVLSSELTISCFRFLMNQSKFFRRLTLLGEQLDLDDQSFLWSLYLDMLLAFRSKRYE